MQSNFSVEGSLTHYGQKLEQCNVEKCWTECLKLSDYEQRKREVDDFNKYGHTFQHKFTVGITNS